MIPNDHRVPEGLQWLLGTTVHNLSIAVLLLKEIALRLRAPLPAVLQEGAIGCRNLLQPRPDHSQTNLTARPSDRQSHLLRWRAHRRTSTKIVGLRTIVEGHMTIDYRVMSTDHHYQIIKYRSETATRREQDLMTVWHKRPLSLHMKHLSSNHLIKHILHLWHTSAEVRMIPGETRTTAGTAVMLTKMETTMMCLRHNLNKHGITMTHWLLS